jgi:hypothetical protein
MEAVIGALIGGILGYAAGWLQQNLDRRRQRKALATALLSELRTADVSLRGLYERPMAIFPPGAYSMLDLSPEHMALFRPATIQAVLEIRDLLQLVMTSLNEAHAGRQPWESTATYARIGAWSGVHRIAEAKRLLESEGGILLQRLDTAVDSLTRDFPPLPASPFPRSDRGPITASPGEQRPTSLG